MSSDFSKVKAFAFDVDGVMTDGRILCDANGQLLRTFDAKDGFGVRMARLNGYPVAIITGGRSYSLRARFLASGVPAEDIYLGSTDKIPDLDDFCSRHGITREDVLFVGDDLPDLPVMSACGIGAVPSDACPEALEAADYVSPFPGGRGCVRDCIEKVMRASGTWVFETARYKKMF